MNTNLTDNDLPNTLTRRAQYFVGVHGFKVEVRSVEENRQGWLEGGVPAAVINRMATFQQRWGGLRLPPAPQYDGGPRYFDAGTPESDSAGWCFEAGTQRTALPYSFMIGPSGEFGVYADTWAPLHATVEGWVESLALTHHALMYAKQITRLTDHEVEDIDLDGFEQVREVMGLADTWWRGPDSLVALYTGEAATLNFPRGRLALIYSGLDDWGLRGGVEDNKD
ncbi:hypothetical protein GCM10022254_55580 [Actinomadura meridiana]|uniref:Uncharacterized protein n=1 Tax=Actinomadura meridiana TaxID=559626 RepID=A0ABP8CG30_9ACTN